MKRFEQKKINLKMVFNNMIQTKQKMSCKKALSMMS